MNKFLIISLVYLFSLLLLGCEGCTRSGRKRLMENHKDVPYRKETASPLRVEQEILPYEEQESFDEFTVKMIQESGIYKIPVEINGSDMNFIFDTGASDITISNVEAMYLYKQGKLSKEDILGSQQYQIADGSIAEGTIINLRTVKLGNRTLKNVKASIVHNNEAPLLLGQSALAQFGKVSIDYKKNEITFE
jgi:aspartyl protease family protein